VNDKYIIHETLDTRKIGIVLAGLEKKRVLTESESLHAELMWATFCSHYEIGATCDFIYAVKNELDHLDGRKGPKTAWAKIIRKLNNFSSYVILI